jgi:ATP-dependent DNA ligase
MITAQGSAGSPIDQRKKLLERLLRPHPRLNYVDHVEGHGVGMYAGALALGLESIVAKDAKSPYVEGPLVTWHWQKLKNKEYKRQGKVEFGQSKARR